MHKRKLKYINLVIVLLLFHSSEGFGQKLLIPMDLSQKDHLKAYGITFWTLEKEVEVDWLLNYRGGSFMMDIFPSLERELRLRGVSYEIIGNIKILEIQNVINNNNMEMVKLEKVPSIAIYSPPTKMPWDDAVTMALTYAEVPYKVIWDEEVLTGKLEDYDWLHLHHEDFTGQFGKFYSIYGGAKWYLEDKIMSETLAKKLGYTKVSEEKRDVARWIRDFVIKGGFMFAMCSATDSFDLALASIKTDIVGTPFDGDPVDPNHKSKLDFNQTFAFKDFTVYIDPALYEYSDIDYPASVNSGWTRNASNDYFTLFDFAAKYDPVPTMLTQNHVNVVKGFMGQTTGFKKSLLKKPVVVMGQTEGTEMAKYIHGNVGKGTFTFYAGHDPEDYSHLLNDPPTQLSLHKNSPGYRLILNNVLFPAAKKKDRKTDDNN